MLGSVKWMAVIVAVGAGTLVATLTALVGWAAFTAVGAADAPGIGLVIGVVVGLAAAGYTAGRMAVISHRFHGSLAGLGLTAVWVVVFRLGGSQAPEVQILVFAVLGIVLGGIGGVIGRRAQATRQAPPASR
jgi:hypothetical protein